MNLADNIAKQGFSIKPRKPKVTKDSFFMHPKLRRDYEGIIATLRNIEAFGKEMGHRHHIFSGPPGTGKTLGVDYIATEVGFPVYDGKLIINPQAVTQVFEQLREQAQSQPSILVINEIDKFSSRDAIIDPMQQQTLNQLLDEMDGAESNHNLFIFGTTNRSNNIDPALRRAKRFSKEVEHMPPDREGRLAILKMHADRRGGHKFEVRESDLENAADVTFGYTGADLVGLLNEAFTNSILDNGRTKINQCDFEYALTRTKPSAIKDMPFREPKVRFDDLGGYRDHKDVLRRIIQNSDGSIVLFYGPKGTGKTEFAEALAGEYKYNFIVVSGSEPEDKFVGETGKTIDKYLERAKQLAPCVLLFDEIDALVEHKGFESHKSSWSGLLQARLSKPIPGVYVIGTINRPDRLKGTFIDRFIHKLYFGMPNPEDQETIWKRYLPDSIDARVLVEINGNLSCRDISRAQRTVVDYGIIPNLEVYKKLIRGVNPSIEGNYEDIVKQLGDAVADFRAVKDFIGDKK